MKKLSFLLMCAVMICASACEGGDVFIGNESPLPNVPNCVGSLKNDKGDHIVDYAYGEVKLADGLYYCDILNQANHTFESLPYRPELGYDAYYIETFAINPTVGGTPAIMIEWLDLLKKKQSEGYDIVQSEAVVRYYGEPSIMYAHLINGVLQSDDGGIVRLSQTDMLREISEIIVPQQQLFGLQYYLDNDLGNSATNTITPLDYSAAIKFKLRNGHVVELSAQGQTDVRHGKIVEKQNKIE